MRTRTLTAFRGQSALGTVAFSPDGELIAAAAGRLGTHIRDVGTGRLVKRLVTGDVPYAVAFSPDGELLFVGQYDGRGQLFSTDTWEPVGRPLEGHTGRVTSAEFSRDGRTLVTAAADGTAVLWDVETQKPLGSPLELAPSTFASAALSPDGARAVRRLHPRRGQQLRAVTGGLEAPRLPRRGPRAHRRRVGGRAARAAVSARLRARLTPLPAMTAA